MARKVSPQLAHRSGLFNAINRYLEAAQGDEPHLSFWQTWAVHKLIAWQPMARAIRFEGNCHCKGNYLMSYILPSDGLRGEGQENCGYYCPACEFGNAGSRPVTANGSQLDQAQADLLIDQ